MYFNRHDTDMIHFMLNFIFVKRESFCVKCPNPKKVWACTQKMLPE